MQVSRSQKFETNSAVFVFAFLLFATLSVDAQTADVATSADFEWTKIEEGWEVGKYTIPGSSGVFSSEVILARFNSNRFSAHVVPASTTGASNSDLKTITQKTGGVAGINANFFDTEGKPIGLVVVNQSEKQRVHRGGNTLTGIFVTSDTQSAIVHRDDFLSTQGRDALQAGPRLIIKGQSASIKDNDRGTRRSGVAVTKNGEIILFATALRYPGATFAQIQAMLLFPGLGVTDALNLDGGASSQFFIAATPRKSEWFNSGGDLVPVGLVVKRKTKTR